MSKILVNGMNIHYQRTGEGPDLVMIHGIASNLALWLNIQHALEDFRVTTYDLRGHGYSDMPQKGYTSANMVADLNALLDYLEVEQTHLVGHSFGGLVALHYAVLYPKRVARLVIADTGIPAVETQRKGKPALDAWRERLKNLGVPVPDDKQDDIDYLIKQSRELKRKRSQTSPVRRRFGGLPNIERLARLMGTTSILNDFRDTAGLTLDKICQVSHPTLLSYGERSPSMASCQYLAEHLPNCKSVIIQNGGHFHPVAQIEVFVKNIREFLHNI